VQATLSDAAFATAACPEVFALPIKINGHHNLLWRLYLLHTACCLPVSADENGDESMELQAESTPYCLGYQKFVRGYDGYTVFWEIACVSRDEIFRLNVEI